MGCRYCENDTGAEFEAHQSCKDEWSRRYYADLCVRCGKEERHWDKQWCLTCASDPTYKDYLGESA